MAGHQWELVFSTIQTCPLLLLCAEPVRDASASNKQWAGIEAEDTGGFEEAAAHWVGHQRGIAGCILYSWQTCCTHLSHLSPMVSPACSESERQATTGDSKRAGIKAGEFGEAAARWAGHERGQAECILHSFHCILHNSHHCRRQNRPSLCECLLPILHCHPVLVLPVCTLRSHLKVPCCVGVLPLACFVMLNMP